MSIPKSEMSGTWHWPEDIDTNQNSPSSTTDATPPNPSADEHFKVKEEPIHPPKQEESPSENAGPTPRERQYLPRQCRICLEEVQPTLEPMSEGLPSFLNPTPKVRYVSSDPSTGRLFRPCKCRGSQQYVHEGCLQEWRLANPSRGARNFYECPTCKFQYRMERIRWSRILSSTLLQILITISIMLITIFLFGFIADPIINLYLDPYDTITSGGAHLFEDEEEDGSWIVHLTKGLASLGLLGFVKVFFAMSPWHWWNLRSAGVVGGGRRAGRDRLENISWTVVVIGVITFLAAVWTWVRSWTRNFLETAGERLVDVQGDDPDEMEEAPDAQATT